MLTHAVITLFIVALGLANLPWLHEQLFVFFSLPHARHKPLWLRLLEWFVYYLIWLTLAFGVENKLMGQVTSQGWEFYVITLCLFGIFALPGFIYRYELRPQLDKRKHRSK